MSLSKTAVGSGIVLFVCALSFWILSPAKDSKDFFADLSSLDSKSGYLSRLLINEVPFPGENGYVSLGNTKAAMVQIVWVLEGRLHRVPNGYRQKDVASVTSSDVIDLITAGGVHGQCEGFYRDAKHQPVVVTRVEERVQYLLSIANSGGEPGRFAELINFASGLAESYMKGGIDAADRYAGIHKVGGTYVTGGGYSWMTDQDYYNPGGNFVKIPNSLDGSLGNNRFFTLRKLK